MSLKKKFVRFIAFVLFVTFFCFAMRSLETSSNAWFSVLLFAISFGCFFWAFYPSRQGGDQTQSPEKDEEEESRSPQTSMRRREPQLPELPSFMWWFMLVVLLLVIFVIVPRSIYDDYETEKQFEVARKYSRLREIHSSGNWWGTIKGYHEFWTEYPVHSDVGGDAVADAYYHLAKQEYEECGFEDTASWRIQWLLKKGQEVGELPSAGRVLLCRTYIQRGDYKQAKQELERLQQREGISEKTLSELKASLDKHMQRR